MGEGVLFNIRVSLHSNSDAGRDPIAEWIVGISGRQQRYRLPFEDSPRHILIEVEFAPPGEEVVVEQEQEARSASRTTSLGPGGGRSPHFG
jgi:hypothetical protein